MKALCAICDCTNATTRLCRACRGDPANAGWIAEWEDTSTVPSLDTAAFSERHLAGIIGSTLPLEVTPKQLLVFKLLLTPKVCTKARIDRRGRRRGTRRQSTAYTTREIAAMVGVCQQYVVKLRRRLFFGA